MALLQDSPVSVPIAAVGIVLVLWYIVSTITSYRRLSHIPGPPLAHFSSLWMIRTSSSGRLSQIFEETGRKYGPLVRIGPNQVLTSDVGLLRRTGAVRDTYERDEWYNSFKWQPQAHNLFTLQDREAHDRRKAQVAVAYNISGREVDLLEPSVDEQILSALHLLRSKYVVAATTTTTSGAAGDGSIKRTQPPPLLDFASFSSYLTIDVVTRAAFGREFGDLRTDSDVTGFLINMRSSWPLISLVNESPWARRLLYSDRYLKWFGASLGDQTGVGKVRA